jgi:hypothetical protein
MNNSFGRLIDGMCGTLREHVLPQLTDEFARGQVYGVIFALNTLKVRGDWSTTFLSEELAAQRSALEELTRLAASVPVPAPWATVPELPPATPAARLEQLRNDGARALTDALAWLSRHRDAVPSAVAGAMEEAIRRSARVEIEIEMKNAARPMFAEMSGADS